MGDGQVETLETLLNARLLKNRIPSS